MEPMKLYEQWLHDFADDAETAQPLAGRLIALDIGIRGLPPRLFRATKR